MIQTGKRGVFGLLKCDACVERIHFTPRTSIALVGRKVMARNLSDIAAMGGKPLYALVSASLPDRISDSKRNALVEALRRTGRRFGCEVIGGDTTRSKSDLFLSVFVYGEVERKHLLTRSGAKPGHEVFVTGKLGGSLAGKHLAFQPRLAEARWLASRFKPSAAIDLSDGLGGDLHRLAEQSNVGFKIDERRLPLSDGCSVYQALYDGEDYEILFCVPKSKSRALMRAWKKKFRLPLTRIGRVKPRIFGVQLYAFGKLRPIASSYDHFRHHA